MKYLLVLFFAILYEIYASCPNGTFPNVAGDKCYFIPNGAKQFILAELDCKQQNGDLVSISNAFDNMALTGKTMGGFLRAALGEKTLRCAQRCSIRAALHAVLHALGLPF